MAAHTANAANAPYSDARGRSATSPSEIPRPGWKDILWRVYREIGKDRVPLVAAGVTFYLLLAFVPALAALVSLYGFFAEPATINQHVGALRGVIPGGGMDILEEQLTRLSESGRSTLGLTSLISLAVSLWSANAGVKSLFEAMNVAYDEDEKRSFLKLNAISLAFTLGTIASILVLLGVAVLLPIMLQGLGNTGALMIRILTVAALVVLLTLFLAALYRWGPSREQAQWRWITPGAVLTVIVTAIASALFTWYVGNFGSYNATYGSLGAVIGFMVWIWITMIIVIVGAEINSETEHQTTRDSTTGRERPMGSRGAVMADRVGASYEDSGSQERRRRSRQEPSAEYAAAPARTERLSPGKIALALPVALVMAWMEKRRQIKASP